MSACIYHDAEAVTICPSCDFGVCQACMDGGGDGVCATCFEERSQRQETVSPAAEVRRCNYCRAAEDDLTAIDEEGYCEACRELPRCSAHAELIAVGQCKGCRQEFCRKCLGFTDYCQNCAAKEKAKPQAPRPPAAAGASRPAGARKKKRPEGARPPAGKRPSGTKPLPGGKEKPGDGSAPKKKKPSRGRQSLEAKLTSKADGKGRMRIIVVAVVGAMGLLVMLSGMYLQASSPEEQAKRLQANMVIVHRAVINYYRKVGALPKTAADIRRSLADLHVHDARSIRIAVEGADARPTSSVLYDPTGNTFFIEAVDMNGKLLKTENGSVISLDQYFDSSSQ